MCNSSRCAVAELKHVDPRNGHTALQSVCRMCAFRVHFGCEKMYRVTVVTCVSTTYVQCTSVSLCDSSTVQKERLFQRPLGGRPVFII